MKNAFQNNIQISCILSQSGQIRSKSSGTFSLGVTPVTSSVSQITQIKTGDRVSYKRNGEIFTASGVMDVAVADYGYVDVLRQQQGARSAGVVHIRGSPVPNVGRVCMDMSMYDVTGVPGVREGDEVVMFGGTNVEGILWGAV